MTSWRIALFVLTCALLIAIPETSEAQQGDASIRRLLQMNDREVAHDFPTSVRIHIVASRTSADETVLATAAGPDRYVVSNDRIQDFAGAAAVRGND